MDKGNETSVTEFILFGLTDDPNLQVPLFLMFLFIYVFTAVTNIGISSLIIVASQLHTPMYFFVSILSLSDFCYSSVTAPKMLRDLLSENKSISFISCVVQALFFIIFGASGAYMLSAMAYDRYAAICHPLLYPVIMNKSMCMQLVAIVYLSGIISAVGLTGCAFSASFCGSNVVDHFCCDVPSLMEMSCSDRFVREITYYSFSIFIGVFSLLITITSYIYIISAILKISSTTGRMKTFSTCGSHLTSLSLLYVTGFVSYLRVQDRGSGTQRKVLSMCYITLTPMLNPLIYSLKNKEVTGVMRTLMHRRCYLKI